jgi:hypothetical protein
VTTGARNEDVLRAPRIRQQVLVARGHPNPERVRRQLHDALSTHLGDALAGAFAQLGTPHDSSVWRIRKLTLDVTVNAQWDAPRLARAWAAQLARVVRRTIESGGEGALVRRWASPAEYLASFVREAADGTAGSRWWFDSFSGLRLLARSAQIRTALLRDAPLGGAALVLMPAADLALVVAQLSATDARVVLDAIVPGSEAGDAEAAAGALLEAHRVLGASPSRAGEERWALRLVVEALRIRPGVPTGAIANIARAIGRLSLIAAEQPARMAAVRRLLAGGNVTGLRLVLGDGDAERLAPVARASRAALDAISEPVAKNAAPGAPTARETDKDIACMPVGAPLILAPLAAMLPLGEATRGWPAIGGEDEPPARSASAASLVRLLALATACGGERAARVLADPTARRLAGVGNAVSIGQMRDWLGELDAADAARLEQTVGGWRAESGTVSTGTWLLTDAAGDDLPEAPACLALLDCARGHWLGLRDGNQDCLGGSLRALQYWFGLPPAANGPRELLVAADHAARIATEIVPPGVEVRLAADLSLDSRRDDPIAATLARCDRLAGELDWLALPASLGVPRPMELALAVVAQGILRDLAWRLPGFARASLPYLWVNFLAVDAQLEQEPQRLAARLGRPPLAMVIAMTGLMRSTYRLPWLGATQIALFPSDGA